MASKSVKRFNQGHECDRQTTDRQIKCYVETCMNRRNRYAESFAQQERFHVTKMIYNYRVVRRRGRCPCCHLAKSEASSDQHQSSSLSVHRGRHLPLQSVLSRSAQSPESLLRRLQSSHPAYPTPVHAKSQKSATDMQVRRRNKSKKSRLNCHDAGIEAVSFVRNSRNERNAKIDTASLLAYRLLHPLLSASGPLPRALPLDPAGGSAPDPRYRLALHALAMAPDTACSPNFQILPTPMVVPGTILSSYDYFLLLQYVSLLKRRIGARVLSLIRPCTSQ